MAKTILFDGSLLGRRYAGSGVHRYAASLLRELERITLCVEEPVFRVLVPSDARSEFNGRGRPGFEFASQTLMQAGPLWKFGQMFMLAARRMKSDAIFLPFPYPIYFKTARLAVTVHDLIPLLFPGQYKSARGRILQHSFRTSLARADLILTDSERSKADMVSLFGIPPERVVVAYLGFDSELFGFQPGASPASAPAPVSRLIKQPYILHVGTLQPRKNLLRLVQAYRALLGRRKDLDFQLAICGPAGPGSEELLRLLHEPELEGHALAVGPVSDRELAALYRGALCCAMPSLYEGFGLPVLEAMASGCPVMCSNSSCLPEIAAHAALYFNPESVEEMSAVMERLLTDSVLRAQLAERGLERARQFSWEACARITLKALNDL